MRLLDLKLHGAQHVPHALTDNEVAELEHNLNGFPENQAGVRITDAANLRGQLAANGAVGRHAARHLGPLARPVRAILFDKSPLQNWSLNWHQDRTIAVLSRAEVPGFGPWTIKSGIIHVSPPQDLLNPMITLRIHLDTLSRYNAPLLIAPGSHRFGRIVEDRIPSVVAERGIYVCLAQRRDIWIYSTPILHASETSSIPGHRRVLQIDYSADNLPPPLEWLGV